MTRKLFLLPGDGIGPEAMNEVRKLIAFMNDKQNAGFETDYLEILDADNLSEITERTNKILIAVAVNYKKVRLIDNILVSL